MGAVNHLRSVLLVLLAVLLPIRGTVAAAMPCPGQAAALHHLTQLVQVGQGPQHGPAGDDLHSGHGRHTHPAAAPDAAQGSASDPPSAAGHTSTCQFCAGGCCVAPLAFAPPSVHSPRLTASAVFPALVTRIPAGWPDGQDRPPRTR